MPVQIDEKSWPIVCMTYQGTSGDAEMSSAIHFYQRMFVRGQRFSVVLDTRQASPPSLSNMQSFKKFSDKNASDFSRYCAGIAFVVSGGVVMRMALRSLMQLSSPPFPHQVFGDANEAMSWCGVQLQAAVA